MLALLLACTDVASVFGQSWTADMAEEKSHDFQDAFEGDVPEHRFLITNTNNSAVTLKPRVSAGPFIVSVTADSIKAGETAELVCKASTATGMRGERNATATLRISDGGKHGELQFVLKVNFVPKIVVSSPVVCFSDFEQGKDNLKTLSISASKNSGLKLADVRSKSKYIQAKILEVEESEKYLVYKVRFKLLGDATESELSGKMNLIFASDSSAAKTELGFYTTRLQPVQQAN